MVCYVHPDRPAVGTCTSCGRPVCSECAVNTAGRIACRECLARGVAAPPAAAPQAKDPSTAFLIELVGGIFGLLGLGYLYAGRTNDGLIRLVAWLVFIAVAWTGIALLSVVLIGIICIPIQIILQIAVPIWSALSIKNEMEGKPAPFSRL